MAAPAGKELSPDGDRSRREIRKAAGLRIRRPLVKEPRQEDRQVRGLRVEVTLFPGEFRPGLVDEPLAKLAEGEFAQLRDEVVGGRADSASKEFLRRFDGAAVGAQAALLVLPAAAARAGIVAAGLHGVIIPCRREKSQNR